MSEDVVREESITLSVIPHEQRVCPLELSESNWRVTMKPLETKLTVLEETYHVSKKHVQATLCEHFVAPCKTNNIIFVNYTPSGSTPDAAKAAPDGVLGRVPLPLRKGFLRVVPPTARLDARNASELLIAEEPWMLPSPTTAESAPLSPSSPAAYEAVFFVDLAPLIVDKAECAAAALRDAHTKVVHLPHSCLLYEKKPQDGTKGEKAPQQCKTSHTSVFVVPQTASVLHRTLHLVALCKDAPQERPHGKRRRS